MGNGAPSHAVIRQAAKWLALLHSGTMTDAERHKLADWRAAKPEHEQAWQHAERLAQKLTHIPLEIGMPVLDRKVNRRDFLKPLALFMVVMPTGMLAYHYTPWREWTADYRTATGERREIVLEDGSRLVLNTASAVNIVFTHDQRLIHLLAGEILIQTAPDPQPVHRPLLVQTAEGSLRALGTRFTVRQQDDLTQLAVLEGAVEAAPHAIKQHVNVIVAGMHSSLTEREVHAARPLDEKRSAWAEGILYVDKMPLGEFVAELSRYRPGVLRCEPDIAHLEVSGVFQLNDTDRILAALQNTLPVELHWRTRYWVMLARAA